MTDRPQRGVVRNLLRSMSEAENDDADIAMMSASW